MQSAFKSHFNLHKRCSVCLSSDVIVIFKYTSPCLFCTVSNILWDLVIFPPFYPFLLRQLSTRYIYKHTQTNSYMKHTTFVPTQNPKRGDKGSKEAALCTAFTIDFLQIYHLASLYLSHVHAFIINFMALTAIWIWKFNH